MKYGKIWMAVSILIIISLSIIAESSLVQIIAAVCGVIYVFSTALELRSGQLFGVINSALYGYIMFKNSVFGTAIYDFIYCVPMQLYTFFAWGKDKQGKDKIRVSKYSVRQRIIIFIALMLIVCVYSVIASKLSVQFALVDGISIILGSVALYMTSKKKIEQWYLYIICNIATLCLWTVKCIQDISNIPMIITWIIYLINNIYGLYSWRKKIQKSI